MTLRILVVDDSVVFRSQIKAALEDIDGITVVGSAANGKIALERIEQGTVDVVILDLEMPEMSGLEMLSIMRQRGMRQTVIVFAAPSGTGVEMALAALRAGASDFIAKPQSAGSLEQALAGVQKDLIPKILQFREKIQKRPVQAPKTSPSPDGLQADLRKLASGTVAPISIASFRPKVVAIGSSTGGPAALDSLFSKLKGQTLRVPVFIAQHMPPLFTEYLAKRIGEISGHPAKEAKDGEIVQAGIIYVAPGDYHMTVERSKDGTQVVLRLDQGPKRNSVRPAVDSLFESLAKVYAGGVAAFVLTGMGEDGTVGAKAIKSSFGKVVIQDQASSVVWGMPGAVHDAGAFDSMGNLESCSETLLKLVG